MSALTFFDSQSALTKFANRGSQSQSNEWAPGTTIGSLNQASSGTNFNTLVDGIVGAAVKGAVTGAK